MILFYHRLKSLSTASRSRLRCFSVARNAGISLPTSADVVIIGGGSAGCHTLYHLAKKGVKAVLLERAKLTAGTTWHTAGCVWRFRPNDVDVELLTSSRNMLLGLEAETGQDPGWIQNGGIFIAHSSTRLDEYKRLATIGNAFGIENYVLSPAETKKIFPLLDENSFFGALYSPGDGVIDPNMLCRSLTKAATNNGGQVVENCAVNGIVLENKKVVGVSTPFGIIRTEVVVNSAGVWGRDLVQKYGVNLPLIPMRHAYIVSETMAGVRGLPNIRDHDFSTYFRVQGDSLCMGGYENNPIILDNVPSDFVFSLYDLDWSVFDTHMKGAINLCPDFGKAGIKSTVCGPESFTPDHKPLMGPDPNLTGLFHNCGFNALGIMFGGGCAEQLALWITKGQPDLYMFQFDLKRFASGLSLNSKWVQEKSHESYSRNYKLIFVNDQPLAGRNVWKAPLHDILIGQGAIMEEKQGWERPSFFNTDGETVVQPYDWYGYYGFKANSDRRYKDVLAKDLTYGFSGHHELIGKEVMTCRNRAVLFDMSSVGKMYLDGTEALQVANWIFSGDVNQLENK